MTPGTTDDVLIRVEGVHFARAGRPVFDGLDLTVRRGRVVAIMGPSGTGKTTLLRLIGGQLRPDRGRVMVDGQEVARLGRGDLFRLRERMGVLFQSGALLTDLSVYDNVPAELSGGMARRVALARAIALDPLLVLYDEPFTGQDPISMGVLVRLIRRLNDAMGLTSVVVSHDVEETAAIADDIYVISGGKVVEQGSRDELAASTSPWVRQFMRGEPDGPVPFHYPAPDLADDLLGGEGA
jgi:phospholipid/cholesterol/gamma-HCH transport system ATP-binding protein